MFEGILLIDKPKGWTSFDVVNKVRSVIRQSVSPDIPKKKLKVGHAGTLDPLAEGLLIILVGPYTKNMAEFESLKKAYKASVLLGQTSTTADEEGEKSDVSSYEPTTLEVQEALSKLSGPIEQTPPAYSAVKVDGKRAYKLAREGKIPEIKPRQVTIYGYSEVDYQYPLLKFEVEVSKGTYIRSLAVDIGQVLNTGAYLKALTRVSVGDYQLKDAISPENITIEDIGANLLN
jgi:tRNA pseudouridine55 synthase